MRRLKQRYRAIFGRIAFNDPSNNPFDDAPITDEELEDWEQSFEEDLTPEEESK